MQTMTKQTPARETVTPTRAIRLMRSMVAAGRPAFLWGHPAIGKSEAVRALADALYAEKYGVVVEPGGKVRDRETGQYTRRPYFKDVRGSTLDAVDMRGMPAVDAAAKRASFVPFDFLPTEGEGIIVFDELPRAHVSVQNALLEYILDGRIGEHERPAGWYACGAGNYVSDGGGSTRLTSALSSRFGHLYIEADFMEWRTWALQNGIHPYVIAYLTYCHKNPTLPDGTPRRNAFCDYDPKADNGPSPRSWKFVSDVLWTEPEFDDLLVLVQAFVGYPATIEFLGYVRLYKDLPDVDDCIARPDAAPVPGEISAIYALASALAARMTVANVANVYRYLARLPQEFMTMAITDAIARDESLKDTGEYARWQLARRPTLQAA